MFWYLCTVLFCSRFLLARHKAAVDVYNEAGKMSNKDWVGDKLFISLNLFSCSSTIMTSVDLLGNSIQTFLVK